jgi:hypothetical protein
MALICMCSVEGFGDSLRNYNYLIFPNVTSGEVAKLRKLTVLLIAASLVYVAFAWFRYLSYQDWIREAYLSYPESMRPFVDFMPFHSSREGSLTIVGGALLGIVWVLHLSRPKITEIRM